MKRLQSSVDDRSIAIIGIAARFPGAPDKDAFWRNQVGGRNCVTEVPDSRWDWRLVDGDPVREEGKSNSRWGAFLDDIDQFDPLRFGISPAEAEVMDPQHRLFVKAACEAIWDAGYSPTKLAGTQVGVFAGVQFQEYQQLLLQAGIITARVCTGNAQTMLANRVSFLLDLGGPSESIDTSCSSSLVALQHAISALQAGDCDMALAGGANLMLVPDVHIMGCQLGVLSPTGQCRPLDAEADGYVRGEGVGIILLKPLSRAIVDRDHVYAVLKGCAVNHGGRGTSLTAPRAEAQAAVMSRALRVSGVEPEQVSYVEMHATGTVVGDPIEFEAVRAVFGGERSREGQLPCGLGSIKSNIGHLEAASGIAGVINLALAMKARWLPGMSSFRQVNPKIDLAGTRFYLNGEGRAWELATPDERLFAVVNSFGFGGTNGSVVLEQGPSLPPTKDSGEWRYLPLSVSRDELFPQYAKQLKSAVAFLLSEPFERRPALADIAHTLSVGRDPLACRRAIRVNNLQQLLAALDAIAGVDRRSQLVGCAEDAFVKSWPEHVRRWLACETVEWPIAAEACRVSLPSPPWNDASYWYRSSTPGKSKHTGIFTYAPAHRSETKAEFLFLTAAWRAERHKKINERHSAGNILVLGEESADVADFKTAIASASPSSNVVTMALQDLKDALGTILPGAHWAADELRKASSSAKPDVIFIIPSATDAQTGALEIESLFYLTKELIQRSGRRRVQIYYVAPEPSASPAAAALGSFAKSAYLENKAVQFCLVHVARASNPDWRARVVDEWRYQHSEKPCIVKLERSQRFVEGLDECVVPSVKQPLGAAFKSGGVYFVPGGAGELGQRLLSELLRNRDVTVILAGRSSRGPETEQRLATMAAGKSKGANLDYLQCDVTSDESVRSAVAAIIRERGKIDGILMLATDHRDASIFKKSWEDFDYVSAGKVVGTINLDEATAGLPLDFFVTFSSQAVLGIAGGSDYAFGCGFQNQFALWRNEEVSKGHRSGRTMAINWSRWQWDKYVTSEFDQWVLSLGYHFIDEKVGLTVLDRLIGSGAPRIYALCGDVSRIAAGIDRSCGMLRTEASDKRWEAGPSKRAEQVEGLLDQLGDEELQLLARKLGLEVISEREMKGDVVTSALTVNEVTVQPADDATQMVANKLKIVFEQELKIDNLDEDAELTKLGVDSIIAINVVQELETFLETEIDLTWLFEYPTIRALAAHIVAQGAGRPPTVAAA